MLRPMADGTKVCSHCRRERPLEEFRILESDDPEERRHSWCRECLLWRRRAYERRAYERRRRLEAAIKYRKPRPVEKICRLCYGLPHRVTGERCKRCGQPRGEAS